MVVEHGFMDIILYWKFINGILFSEFINIQSKVCPRVKFLGHNIVIFSFYFSKHLKTEIYKIRMLSS